MANFKSTKRTNKKTIVGVSYMSYFQLFGVDFALVSTLKPVKVNLTVATRLSSSMDIEFRRLPCSITSL